MITSKIGNSMNITGWDGVVNIKRNIQKVQYAMILNMKKKRKTEPNPSLTGWIGGKDGKYEGFI